MVLKNSISPQYLRNGEINVTILDVKNPAHYIIRESPNIDVPSKAQEFLEVEDSMQKYYGAIEPNFFQLPLRDAIVVVDNNKKFYRAKVISILNLARGHMIKVYLLDYGKECSVPRSCLFEIHPDFLIFPFQAIVFKLLDLEPISLVMNQTDLSLDYGPVSEWDPSASTFVAAKFKAMINAFIKVEGTGQNCLFGTLHVTFPDGDTKCINDELVLKKFAHHNPDCMNYVTRLDAVLSKEESSPSPSKSSEPESNCPSSEPKCLSPTSAEMPKTKPKVCGALKLRELLRAKRKQQQQEDQAKSVALPTSVMETAELIDSTKHLTLADECKHKHEDIIAKPKEFQEDTKCEGFKKTKHLEMESGNIQKPSIPVTSVADSEISKNVADDDVKSKQPVTCSTPSEPGATKGKVSMAKVRELYRKHRRLELEKAKQDATRESASEDAHSPVSASGGVQLLVGASEDETSKTKQELSSPKENVLEETSCVKEFHSLKVADDSKTFDLNSSPSTSSCNRKSFI